jgi:hypothetical protein
VALLPRALPTFLEGSQQTFLVQVLQRHKHLAAKLAAMGTEHLAAASCYAQLLLGPPARLGVCRCKATHDCKSKLMPMLLAQESEPHAFGRIS